MDETRKLNEMKPLEEMNVIDDFLFTPQSRRSG